MKRTIIFTLVLTLVIAVSSFVTSTDSFASNTANKASLLPWFSVTILNGGVPVVGAKVTITGPSGTTQQNSDSNGQVCTSHNYGWVRVSFTANGGLSGCKDINHQSQTVCWSNPYTVSNDDVCNED